MMNSYVICLEKVEDGYVVSVPDIPGCFSAGDTYEEAQQNVAEAIVFHIEGLMQEGEPIPLSKGYASYKDNPDFQGMELTTVPVDLKHLLGKTEKINVSMPSLLVRRIDNFIKKSPQYKNRSDFLTQVASERILSP